MQLNKEMLGIFKYILKGKYDIVEKTYFLKKKKSIYY